VNLFSETAEPIYLAQQKYEYQVFPDVHRQNATEVYSIDEVFTTDPRTNNVKTFSPFYSVKHSYENKAERVFWYASRRASQRLNDQGSEVFLSLVDTNFDPRTPADEVIIVKATCSNRDLPARLPFGGKEGDFEIEGAALVSRIRCLTKPTETLRPPMRRALQWRLISHLNLNILSLLENESGEPEALKEILQLYNYSDSTVIEKQINGIVGVSCRKVVRQIGERIGAGFVRGLETTIEFDEEQYIGGGLFLLASVLERFLSLYVTVNSFNQLVIRTKQREAEVKRWSPRAGEQSLL
jgi:type VI secretion system protein ImpG